MTSKIFRSTLLVAVIVLLCSLGIITGTLYSHFSAVQVNQLKDELSLAVTATEQYGNEFLENMESGRLRITWVDKDGTVLYDTRVTVSDMENHMDREEIREALQNGTGSSSRYSDTLTEKTLYEAERLDDGTVLRISASQASAAALVFEILRQIILVAVIAIVISALLAKRIAKRIVEPLNRLDLEHPLRNDAYEEIAPLLQRINKQHLQIASQLETLRRKTDEFEQITENMKEGLVLLNCDGAVLSINSTARDLFGVERSCIGRSFLTVDRNQEMRAAVNDALDTGSGTLRAARNGRNYQFDLSRIESDGAAVGAVVLAFDITEMLDAECRRREFSANVSHELKTPLQSIIGSAELLQNGIVKAEDMPRFAGHIRGEATRLVNLIEDIIRLSQLDEGAQLPMEEVDLLPLCEEAVAVLRSSAESKGVSVRLSGTGCHINGVRRLLYEIIYNLCDNAIKYNKEGGSVKVTVESDGEHPVLTVCDTGIGIPPEHQPRVFERFYRVDKSHSKQSGGTGLGLSIVKHAVGYHNAKLELQSVPNKGTKITVRF